jgi:hypothetical protein
MASRYDALQTREDMNNPIRLQEDQDVASVQQYEYQDVSVASERSSVSIQQHEYQNFSVANENLVNAAQQHKNKDVQTTVVPAHKAEMHEGQPVTVRAKWTCIPEPNNTSPRLCAESASGPTLYSCSASLELRHSSFTSPFSGLPQVATRIGKTSLCLVG